MSVRYHSASPLTDPRITLRVHELWCRHCADSQSTVWRLRFHCVIQVKYKHKYKLSTVYNITGRLHNAAASGHSLTQVVTQYSLKCMNFAIHCRYYFHVRTSLGTQYCESTVCLKKHPRHF